MTTIWETTIRTGNPAYDQQQVAQVKGQYEAQGYTVQVEQLQSGGFHVRVVHPVGYHEARQGAPYAQSPFSHASAAFGGAVDAGGGTFGCWA